MPKLLPLFLSTAFGGRSFINSFNQLLDARYHAEADLLVIHSPCCQMAYYSVGETKYLYRSPKEQFRIVCTPNMESKTDAATDGRLKLTHLVAK